jgi:Phosphatidylethanolamine-binding protein
VNTQDEEKLIVNTPYSNHASPPAQSYLPPTPPQKTGRHRHVFVLLRGEGGVGVEYAKGEEALGVWSGEARGKGIGRG